MPLRDVWEIEILHGHLMRFSLQSQTTKTPRAGPNLTFWTQCLICRTFQPNRPWCCLFSGFAYTAPFLSPDSNPLHTSRLKSNAMSPRSPLMIVRLFKIVARQDLLLSTVLKAEGTPVWPLAFPRCCAETLKPPKSVYQTHRRLLPRWSNIFWVGSIFKPGRPNPWK